MTLTVDDRELIERLTRKVQALPATGGAGVSAAATDGLGNPVETKYFSYITDDGKRLANPDGPAAADRLQSLLSDGDKLRTALQTIADDDYEPLVVDEGESFTAAAAQIAAAALRSTDNG